MNIPTKNLKIRTQMKDEAIAVNMPYQNKKNVAHSNVGRRPNLSAIIPHSGEPSIIPEKQHEYIHYETTNIKICLFCFTQTGSRLDFQIMVNLIMQTFVFSGLIGRAKPIFR